jgi:thiol-disulfide isomerase/thioredoxin
MRDLDGRTVASTNFAGQVVVLNFWATWCPTCLIEIPDLNAYHAAHVTNGLVVIGASTDETGAETVRDFVRRNRIEYPVLMADAAAQDAFGGIPGLPVTLVIARDGRFFARYHGPLTRKELESVVTPLLSAPWPAPGTLVPAEPVSPAGTSGLPRIPPPPLFPPGR